MNRVKIGEISMINRGGNMDRIKAHAVKLWSLALAHKKVSAVIVAIVVILILLN
jgi:hypothetical protein